MIHKTSDFYFNDCQLGDNIAIVYSLLFPVLSFFFFKYFFSSWPQLTWHGCGGVIVLAGHLL